MHGAATLPEVQLLADDLLLTSPRLPGGPGLAVLEPGRFGHPMLGRRRGSDLEGLPSGLPCAPGRWRVAGQVVALWRRDLSRQRRRAPEASAEAPAPPARERAVVVRILGPHLVLARLAAEVCLLLGPGASVTAADDQEARVEARLSLTPEGTGRLAMDLVKHAPVPLVVAVADSPTAALALARSGRGDDLLLQLPGVPLPEPAVTPDPVHPEGADPERRHSRPSTTTAPVGPLLTPHPPPAQLSLFSLLRAA